MANLPHHLPTQPTAFIGRKSEVAAIVGLLADPACRLLTLVGPGGIGKTRLSLEAARQFVHPTAEGDLATLFVDGAYLVTLQAANSNHDIMQAVAGAIDFEFYSARSPGKQLVNHLADQHLLLILDNLEHLPDAAAFIDELLTGVPHLNVLATSRLPLNTRAEWLFQVGGMHLPASESDGVASYDAVQLFVDRARRVRHNFSLAEEQACVVQLCHLVGGMPLALELSATWLKSLSCPDIVIQIQNNLDLLEVDMRGVPERHRSMRAVFNHSWQLLDPEERDLFMKLTVFQGAFRREAAEKITGAPPRLLAALVDKSMVVFQNDGRYQIHELQRQYGAEQLAQDAEMETTVRNQHCAYYLTLMDRPFRDFYGWGSQANLKAIDAEIEDIHAAWKWAVAQSRFRDMHRCIEGLYHYSFLRFRAEAVTQAFEDGVIALRQAEAGMEREVTLGLLLAMYASVDIWSGRPQHAGARIAESIAILEPLPARRELAAAMVSRAWFARFEPGRDREQAKTLILAAVDILKETARYELLGFMYTMLAGLHYDIGQFQDSEYWDKKSLELSQTIDDPRSEASTLEHRGRQALALGEYASAREFLLAGLAIATALDNPILLVAILDRLGETALAAGDLEAAENYSRQSLTRAQARGTPYHIAHCLLVLAHIAFTRRDFEQAAALYRDAAKHEQKRHSLQTDRLWGLGQIALAQGDYATAERLHEENLQIAKQNNYRRQIIRSEEALGRIALARNLNAQAKRHFQTALQESIAMAAPPVMLDSLLSVGELAAAAGDQTAAIELVQLIMNHPACAFGSAERAAQLLRQLDADVLTQDGTISGQNDAQADLTATAETWLARLASGEPGVSAPSQTLVDPLSERELELLQLVALGRSNREIAAELILALGTVKSHLHNIFQKLAVNSRTQAIVRARELDLL